MKDRRLAQLGLVVALLVPFAGCGGDDEDDSGGSAATQTEQAPADTSGGGGAAEKTSSVSMSEYKFDPSDVSATAGSTITVRNEGALQHDLRLREGGKDIGGTKVFGKGQAEKLKLDFPAGSYEMFCSVPGHEQSGMKGSFTIE